MELQWNDYSDEEFLAFLQKNPSQLKIARAAPDLLGSLKDTRLMLRQALKGSVTSPDDKELAKEIQQRSFELITHCSSC